MATDLALTRLTDDATVVVTESWDRLERAFTVSDTEQIVGCAKDLVESVCKVVIDSLGGSYTSRQELPALGKAALEMLEMHPSGFQERDALKRLAIALSTVPSSVARLRNSDGTGHGRSRPSDFDMANAAFIGEIASSWARWCLSAIDRVLAGRAEISQAEQAILSGRTFRMGELRAFLEEVGVDTLDTSSQRRLGLAVGRRAASGTFNVSTDVLEPLAAGDVEYPEDFIVGILEGLFVDANGRLRCDSRSLKKLGAMVQCVGASGLETLAALCETLPEAEVAYAFQPDEQAKVIAELESQAASVGVPEIATGIESIARLVEDILRSAD